MSQAALLNRVRTNDPSLLCLRVTPSLPVQHVAAALLQNSTINQLLLSGNAGNEFALYEFATVLEASQHLPLITLDVSNLSLNDDFLLHVVELVKASKTLTRLDISQNVISVRMCELLGKALAHHPSMRRLEWQLSGVGDDGLRAFMKAITVEGCHLTTIHTAYNRIGPVVGKEFCQFIHHSHSLTSVFTKGNFIAQSVFDEFAAPTMKKNAENAKNSKKRVGSATALGFLESIEPECAPYPSLAMMSEQVERDNAN